MKKTTVVILFLGVGLVFYFGGVYANYTSDQMAADAHKLMGPPVRTPAAVYAPSESQTHSLSVHDKAEWIRANDKDGTFGNLTDDQAARFYDNLNGATGGK